MNYKISFVIALAIMFVAGNICLAAKNDSSGQEQAQNQVQTQNAGEETQLKTAEQEQSGSLNSASSETGSGTQNQVQNQVQTQNSGEETQIRTAEQQAEQENTSSGARAQAAEQRRSDVANAVQEMLEVADRNGGIGAQVRVIAQEQSQNHEKVEASLKKVQSRNMLIKFFVGPDFKEIKNAEQIMEQNKEKIKQLTQVKTSIKNQGDQEKIAEQIRLLEQAQLQVENSLNKSKNSFSLFGWAFRLFAR